MEPIITLLSKCNCFFHACSIVWDSATPSTVASQAPLSMGFSRQEYWSGVPFPPPGDLSNLLRLQWPLHGQADSLPPSHLRSFRNISYLVSNTLLLLLLSIFCLLTVFWGSLFKLKFFLLLQLYIWNGNCAQREMLLSCLLFTLIQKLAQRWMRWFSLQHTWALCGLGGVGT